MVQTLIPIFYERSWKASPAKVMKMTPIPFAAKTEVWVQHLFLQYLFTYTYLFLSQHHIQTIYNM